MDGLRRDEAPVVAQEIVESEEMLGGEPACWAHLFEDEPDLTATDAPMGSVLADQQQPESLLTLIDLVGVARTFQGRGPAQSLRSADLDLNLLVFRAGEGVAEHLNATVDVMVVVVVGEGVVTIDGQPHPVTAGQLIVIPKGTRRRLQATSERFAYLTCHQRRAGLMPVPRKTA
jgi:quercetin dioxygenase-like cupin family protein